MSVSFFFLSLSLFPSHPPSSWREATKVFNLMGWRNTLRPPTQHGRDRTVKWLFLPQFVCFEAVLDFVRFLFNWGWWAVDVYTRIVWYCQLVLNGVFVKMSAVNHQLSSLKWVLKNDHRSFRHPSAADGRIFSTRGFTLSYCLWLVNTITKTKSSLDVSINFTPSLLS